MLLTNLADVVRDAGLDVAEVPGWQTRMRGGTGGHATGGYVGNPTHVMVHHTASSWPTIQDVQYLATGHQYAPVSNLHLARDGLVTVIAAGATNTNGAGGPVDGCPKDSMNSRAIGIEAGNNGTGEPWPAVQQNVYVRLCAALCMAYRIPVSRVLAHFEWAPTRKIDPAGPSVWANMSDQYMRWNMEDFRESVAARMTTQPPEDDDMRTLDTPERMYDSRTSGGPFGPGETREVAIGMCTDAFVHVTVIGQGGAGHISINDPAGGTSIVNFDGSDRVESDGAPVKTPNGRIAITCHASHAHVVVDCYARKP